MFELQTVIFGWAYLREIVFLARICVWRVLLLLFSLQNLYNWCLRVLEMAILKHSITLMVVFRVIVPVDKGLSLWFFIKMIGRKLFLYLLCYHLTIISFWRMLLSNYLLSINQDLIRKNCFEFGVIRVIRFLLLHFSPISS
jgi:hypothetical protein